MLVGIMRDSDSLGIHYTKWFWGTGSTSTQASKAESIPVARSREMFTGTFRRAACFQCSRCSDNAMPALLKLQLHLPRFLTFLSLSSHFPLTFSSLLNNPHFCSHFCSYFYSHFYSHFYSYFYSHFYFHFCSPRQPVFSSHFYSP